VGELDDLRRDFLRKAMLAAQDRVVRPLLAAGVRPDELATWSLGQVPASDALDRLRARRIELGIPSGDADPLLVHLDGTGVDRDAVRVHLHRARTVRVSIDANGDYCRQLLAERYGQPPIGASGPRGTPSTGESPPLPHTLRLPNPSTALP
jgi:hypothetical protein